MQAGETLEFTVPMYLDDEEISAVTHYVVGVNIYTDELLRVEYEKRHEDFHEQIEE